MLSSAEEERNAPNSGEGYDGVYYTADERFLSTEEPSNNVKLEKSDTSPIECTDNREHQGYSIHNHDHGFLFSLFNAAEKYLEQSSIIFFADSKKI